MICAGSSSLLRLIVVMFAAVPFGGLGVARAGCAGPELTLPSGQSAAVGEEVEVEGINWADFGNCEEGNGCAWDNDDATGEPYLDIELGLVGPLTPKLRDLFEERGRAGEGKIREAVAATDADETGHFTVTFEVPDVPPGDYLIDAGDRAPAIELIVTDP